MATLLNYTAPTTLIPRGSAPDGRKVKGTIHWVSANDALMLRFDYMIDYLKSQILIRRNFLDALNSDSCMVKMQS